MDNFPKCTVPLTKVVCTDIGYYKLINNIIIEVSEPNHLI